ncbi:MAG: hypothetical protein DIU78_018430 [Pseudomonadota bacterium]
MRAALHGTLDDLRQEIAAAAAAGRLDRAATTELAEAVLRREIASARDRDAVSRVRSLRLCARPVEDDLRRRGEGNDAIAAEALLVLLASGRLDPEPFVERYATTTDAPFRALAARAAVDPRDVLFRRAAFVDGDRRVRSAAFEAALAAPDPGDLEVALEAVRLDPDPVIRNLAARLVGRIGGESAVLGLRDRFVAADMPSRLAIVDAWAQPAAFRTGGERELVSVAESGVGLVSAAAVQALVRHGRATEAHIGVLAHSIEHGSDEARRFSMLVAPLEDGRVLAALQRAARDPSPELRVVALRRLLERPEARAGAQKQLRALAGERNVVGAEARSALASVGDRSVIPGLTRDIAAGDAARRQSAAIDAFELGEWNVAVRALADVDPGVRTQVACAIVAARPRN